MAATRLARRATCRRAAELDPVPVPFILASAADTPAGDAQESLRALCAERTAPGPLPGALTPRLLGLAHRVCGERAPDLIVLATTKGDLPRWCERFHAGRPSAGGPGQLAAELGSALGCPAYALSAACASGPAALAEAARLICRNALRRVLVLGGDRLHPFVEEGFAALRAIDPQHCRPFDADRAGLRLGETAAAVLLGSEPAPRALLGWGASMDARHLTAPDREGAGLHRACQTALQRAALDAPAWLCAHGTGTRYNDDSESMAYARSWQSLPVTAWKGCFGHSLGSCGVSEVALIDAALSGDVLPGVAMLRRAGCAGPAAPSSWCWARRA